MRFKWIFPSLFLVLILLCSCAAGPVEAQVWAYDTLCSAKIWGGSDLADVFCSAAKEGETLLSAAGEKQYIAPCDGASLTLSEDLALILEQAQILYRETEGVFDLTVAPLSNLWNVSSATEPPRRDELDATLTLVGWDKVSLSQGTLTFSLAGMGIDIGSVGKGYGADRTVAALKEAGARSGVISFGGNVAVFGGREDDPFRVGIKDPEGRSEYLGILSVTDGSVVTSGAYERYFEWNGVRYHHLLDCHSGLPRESDLASVTVVCSNGAQADLLSTALWLMGGDSGWALYERLMSVEEFEPFEVVFVYEDRTVRVSDGLAASFSLTSAEYSLWEDAS